MHQLTWLLGHLVFTMYFTLLMLFLPVHLHFHPLSSFLFLYLCCCFTISFLIYMLHSYNKFYFHYIYFIILGLTLLLYNGASFPLPHWQIAPIPPPYLSLSTVAYIKNHFLQPACSSTLKVKASGFFFNIRNTATSIVQSPKKQDNYHLGTMVMALNRDCIQLFTPHKIENMFL